MSYRTFDDRIDGLVITFINISAHKKTEEKLFGSEKLNHILLNASSEIKIILTNDLKKRDLNPVAELFFHKKNARIAQEGILLRYLFPKSLATALKKTLMLCRVKENLIK